MYTFSFFQNSAKVFLGFLMGAGLILGSATFAFSLTSKPQSVTTDTPILTLANWNSLSSAFTQIETYLNTLESGIVVTDTGVTIKKNTTVNGNTHIIGDLQVDGTTNLKNTIVNGNLTIVNGGLIIPIGNPTSPVNGQVWIDPTVNMQ